MPVAKTSSASPAGSPTPPSPASTTPADTASDPRRVTGASGSRAHTRRARSARKPVVRTSSDVEPGDAPAPPARNGAVHGPSGPTGGSDESAPDGREAGGSEPGGSEPSAGTPARFTIKGSVAGVLVGVWSPIPVTITNPNGTPITVTNLTVAVSGAPGGCDVDANFETRGSAVPFTVPAHAATYAIPPARRPWIRLRELQTNQNECKGATVALSFEGKASS